MFMINLKNENNIIVVLVIKQKISKSLKYNLIFELFQIAIWDSSGWLFYFHSRDTLMTGDTLRDKRNVTNITVGEFPYMTYDNLYSEAGK